VLPDLAEDAFALHLLFQDLKGLVNVVVSDENLHVVAFLLIMESSFRRRPVW